MEHVSLFWRLICAAVMASIFYFAGSVIFTQAIPISELSGTMALLIYQLIPYAFAALGVWVGWKLAELIVQSTIYLLIADLFIGLINIIWN